MTKMRIMRSLAKSMRMERGKYFPKIFQKSLKEFISKLDFEENLVSSIMWRIVGRGKKPGKAESSFKNP